MVRDAAAAAKKAAEAKLAAMMEAKFLDMFGGDDDGDAGGASGKKKKKAPKGGRAVQAAAARAKLEEEERAGKEAEADAKKGKKRRARDDSDSEDGLPSFSGRHHLRPSAAAAASTSQPSQSSPNGVRVVTFTGDRPNAAASKNVATASGNHLGVSRARKLFMNTRVDKVHEVAVNERAGPKERFSGAYAADGSELGVVEGLTGKSLNDMRREVQLEAAKGLNKWDRKALEAKRLQQLGAKAEKGIRIPATIGVGMWRANEKREEQKRLEQFEAGGRLEKKKRGLRKADTVEAKRKASGDRGLAWGAGNFKGGILTLSKKDVQKDTTHLNTKITLGGDRLAGGGVRKKGKGGKKGKGAKGGKGKRR